MKRKLLPAVLTALVVLALCCFASAETVASGVCGDSLTWTLDDGGTLTISGTGAMDDYTYDPDSYGPTAPWAEYAYTDITDVVVESGVTEIGAYAFYQHYAMERISLPEGLVSIGESAFEATNLTGVDLPSTLTEIGPMAFFWGSLERIVIPEGVTVIGNDAFSYCEGLIDVTLPESLTTLGRAAFANCENLTYLTFNGRDLPDGVDEAFEILESVSIFCHEGSAVDEWATAAGYEPSYFRTEAETGVCGDSAVWTLTPDGTLTISGSGALYDNTDEEADWRWNWNVSRLVIEDGITSIGAYCFSGHDRLADVRIADSVTYIGESAFGYCEQLPSIVIPDSVTGMGDYVFESCYRLRSVKLSGGLTRLGKTLFYDCPIREIAIPGGVTELGEGVFMYTDLERITIPGSITVIPKDAFDACDHLTEVSLPSGLKVIGEHSFANCDSLEALTIPASVEEIGDNAFGNSSNLKRLTFPGEAMPALGADVFDEDADLTIVCIPGSGVEAWANEMGYGVEPLENDSDEPAEHVCAGTVTDGEHYSCAEGLAESIPAGCTEGGYDVYTCHSPDCGLSFRVSTAPAAGHSHDESYAYRAPTCTEDGFMVYNCILCHSMVSEVVPATGHDHGGAYSYKEPTCTEDGFMIYNCILCRSMVSEVVPATGHDHGGAYSYKEPTCTEDGFMIYNCIVCRSMVSEVVPAAGHSEVIDEAVDPTCTAAGLTEGSHCKACGEVLIAQETVPAAGHDHGGAYSYQAPVGTENGYLTYNCIVCREMIFEVVTPTNHIENVSIDADYADGILSWSLKNVCPAYSIYVDGEHLIDHIKTEGSYMINLDATVDHVVQVVCMMGHTASDIIKASKPAATAEPTAMPTPVPTAEPMPEPTAVPTAMPTPVPTPVPTAEPTPEPTADPLLHKDANLAAVYSDGMLRWNMRNMCGSYDVYFKEGTSFTSSDEPVLTGWTEFSGAVEIDMDGTKTHTLMIRCPHKHQLYTFIFPMDRVYTLPANAAAVEAEAFEGTNVQKIVVPAGVTEIGSRAFADCQTLYLAVFEDGDTVVAADAFEGCGDPVIFCPENSAVAAFAEANGLRFVTY